jgi:ABC-2 type transport system ATP-binding protein
VVDGVREVSIQAGSLRARVGNGPATLPAVLSALDSAGVDLLSVSVARPSLDDVYLRYAGRSFQRADAAATSEKVA